MTRREFVEGVFSVGDMISFCVDHDCPELADNIYTAYELNEFIMERIKDDCFGCDDWRSLYLILRDIPEVDYYDLSYDYDAADPNELKDSILNWMDEHDAWDREEGDRDMPTASDDSEDDDVQVDMNEMAELLKM